MRISSYVTEYRNGTGAALTSFRVSHAFPLWGFGLSHHPPQIYAATPPSVTHSGYFDRDATMAVPHADNTRGPTIRGRSASGSAAEFAFPFTSTRTIRKRPQSPWKTHDQRKYKKWHSDPVPDISPPFLTLKEVLELTLLPFCIIFSLSFSRTWYVPPSFKPHAALH